MQAIHNTLLEINEAQSATYVNDESARKRYWAQHPTFFACIKCMDGRVLFPSMTKTPIGIVKAFRAIGGKFEAFWPSFLGRLRKWIDAAMRNGSRACIFVSYHYSASDSHLGCAGWKYDTAAARAHAQKLATDLSYVFGEEITAIVCGIETDMDLLTLHGSNGEVNGKMCTGKSDEEIMTLLMQNFDNLPRVVALDLIPFLKGNAERVSELAADPRALQQKSHDERVIAVGQGFDWLAKANVALIINDADPNLAESIRVAASLIQKNLIDTAADDHATILASIPYREPGTDERQARARAKGLKDFALKVIQDGLPELANSGKLHAAASIMWEPSKRIQIIESD